MGITLNDIAAQRSMLARGEEKRKADWKQAERERLRDHFAAAALTGLMQFTIDAARPGAYVKSTAAIAADAYELADAMLRERNGAVESRETVQSGRPSGVSDAWAAAANQQLRERGYYGSSPRSTNHDAVPEARAEDELKEPNGSSTGEPGGEPESTVRTGNTQEPVAWGILRVGVGWRVIVNNAVQADSMCKHWNRVCDDVHEAAPLYRQPQPTLTDEEREAVEAAIDALVGIEDFSPGAVSADASAATTLRKLLERLA